MQRLSGRIGRFAALAVVAGALSGCGIFSGEMFNESFWASSPINENSEAEFGIAELAKGNYVTAEGHFQKALRANPRDIDALLGAGILYQHTGQVTKSREMYEAVLALRPDESKQFVVWSSVSTRPASQIASVNLSLLETGGTAPAMQQSGQGAAPQSLSQDVGAAARPQPVMGRSAAGGSPTVEVSSTGARMSSTDFDSVPLTSGYGGGDGAVVSRFATLRALRDQGLITQDEYRARRSANLGALLPLTAPPSAAGLDRPVPTTDQIASRLRAISRALEMRAISVSQHAAERSMILDALLPSAPVVVENPGAPPEGLMEAADAVRRLEKLREEGYISSDEYARERQAIELAMRAEPKAAPPPQQSDAAGTGAANPTALQGDGGAAKQKPQMQGPQPAVHLASYRSEQQAERGWAQIRRAHGDLISGFDHEVAKVNLGSKGTYFRLKAGPLPTPDEAKTLCSKLKAKRQFCEPSLMGG